MAIGIGLLIASYDSPGLLCYGLAILIASIYLPLIATTLIVAIGIMVVLLSDAHMTIHGGLSALSLILAAVVGLVLSSHLGRLSRRLSFAEELIRKERRLLKIKVKERTSELERAQAQKTMEVYRFAEIGRVSSSIIHDLANPLTAVSLNFGALETSRDPIHRIHMRDSITHMEQFVGSAREQFRQGSINSNFDVSHHARHLGKMLAPRLRSKKIVFRENLMQGLTVYGDPARYERMLGNVISNAIDACSGCDIDQRRVSVTIKLNDRKTHALIGIADSGVGISDADLHRIFDPFYTSKRNKKGTGIGLTIVNQVVKDELGGDVQVFSKTGVGTTFVIQLPLSNT